MNATTESRSGALTPSGVAQEVYAPMRRKHILDRLDERIRIDENGCWLWLGARYPSTGYAAASRYDGSGRQSHAHRLVYEAIVGPVPSGLQLDHLCRVKHCVNPDHLEPVTASENVRRAVPFRTPITHCPKGHSYSGVNLYMRPLSKPGRDCKTCKREALRRWRDGRVCSVAGCGRPLSARELCFTHYMRMRRALK